VFGSGLGGGEGAIADIMAQQPPNPEPPRPWCWFHTSNSAVCSGSSSVGPLALVGLIEMLLAGSPGVTPSFSASTALDLIVLKGHRRSRTW